MTSITSARPGSNRTIAARVSIQRVPSSSSMPHGPLRIGYVATSSFVAGSISASSLPSNAVTQT